MLKVMLVDDEQVIAKGLSVLIDWNEENCNIEKIAGDGLEALEYLKNNSVDLIISDIRMPGMDGLELLRTIREENISDAYFVVLSGYNDFAYCRQAMRYNCMDFMVKPVAKQDLLTIIRKVSHASEADREEKEKRVEYERSYLENTLISLLFGKNDAMAVDYVTEHMELSGNVRYVDIEFAAPPSSGGESVPGKLQKKLFAACTEVMKPRENYVIPGLATDRESYGVGIIFCNYMAEEAGKTVESWFADLKQRLEVAAGKEVSIIAGRNVKNIKEISKSYGTACILRSVVAFREKKDIYFYEDEVQVSNGGVILLKDPLDALISDISENNAAKIKTDVEKLYDEIGKMGVSSDTVSLNINYLLFRLVHLASEQDNGVDQEEILRYISESSFEEGVMRGSREHLTRFACDYGEYLGQLRGNVSHGVLQDVENEIREKYSENISLRDLSNKYFINSSYLGQLFRKKYGKSFKEYLTEYRISKAVDLLLHTDKKISEIAGMVGYMDIDYFLKKFIEIKGCTPSKFRKSRLS